jgi:sugar fermentation stimulation protein A
VSRRRMDFPQPLARGRLVRRYKRFLADVVLDGETDAVTIHCPNPGSMLGLAEPGATVWLSRSPDPRRKLACTLELVEANGALVGVNTMHPNRLVAEALAAARIPELAGYDTVRAEVKYGDASRVDFLLEGSGRPNCWVEVKGVTLSRRPGLAEWPDCTSTRAARHLRELQAVATAGDRAVVLFVVQRDDCAAVSVAADLDPVFAAELERAARGGVEILAYGCATGLETVNLHGRLDWRPPSGSHRLPTRVEGRRPAEA